MSLLVSILLKERPLETLCISFFTFVFRVDTPAFWLKMLPQLVWSMNPSGGRFLHKLGFIAHDNKHNAQAYWLLLILNVSLHRWVQFVRELNLQLIPANRRRKKKKDDLTHQLKCKWPDESHHSLGYHIRFDRQHPVRLRSWANDGWNGFTPVCLCTCRCTF